MLQLDNMGNTEPDGIIGTRPDAVGADRFTRSFIHMLEIRNKLQDDMSRASGRMIKTVQVRDMELVGASMLSPSNLAFAREQIELSQANYPESLGRVIFINAGNVFGMAMAALKPFVAERTLSRFLVLGAQYQTELLSEVGIAAVQHVCKLSWAAYSKNGTASSEAGGAGPFKATVAVPARSYTERQFVVHAGQSLSWEWSVQTHDVGCVVRFLSDSGFGAELAQQAGASHRSDACPSLFEAGIPVHGEHTTAEEGIIVFTWDNKHAFMRPKVIEITATLRASPPAEQ